MKVTKDIDIKDLKEMLGNMIERCQTSLKPRVELGYETAIRIYDVLEETQIREERHQTLESACTFIEMEDGTQTNEMELYNKTDENDNILRGAKTYEKISKMVEHLQKEQSAIPECFGTFRHEKNLTTCNTCECIKECFIKTNSKKGVPDCYGIYDYKDLECFNCEDRRKCEIETNKRKEEDDDFI